MNERPKNHFRRLVPYGLIWGATTGLVLHIWWHGLNFSKPMMYWATLIVIWGAAGLLWAYLTSKFSKPKSNSNKEVS